nr:ABC transporter permease [Natronomonas gomsonensis]
MVADGLWRTAQYVVPATVLAVLSGIALGLYGALTPGSRGDRLGRLGAYVALAVPNFFLGFLVLLTFGDFTLYAEYGTIADNVWTKHVFPVVLLSTTLTGAMVSYTRASANEHVDTAFVKLVRAKGGSDRRVARHVLKNAAPPLFALLFAELLAALLVAVFVIESVFGIDGFGSLVLTSVYDRDVPVLLAITYVVVLVGVVGNLLQDFVSATLDPRTES